MTAQEEFDAKYITSIEITQKHGLSRLQVFMAVHKGIFPDCVEVGMGAGVNKKRPAVRIWEREKLAPHLAKYKSKREGLHA